MRGSKQTLAGMNLVAGYGTLLFEENPENIPVKEALIMKKTLSITTIMSKINRRKEDPPV